MNKSRTIWIVGALGIACFVFLSSLSAGIGIGLVVFKIGPFASEVTGKWEANGMVGHGMKAEFRANGTGSFSSLGWDGRMEVSEFKWHITNEVKPVLVMEGHEMARTPMALIMGEKWHFHFKREGDTLELFTLNVIQADFPRDRPLLVFRRLR